MAGSTALPRATPLLAEQRALLGGIAANTPAIRAEAEICDAQGTFPRQAMALLEAEGLLRATLPAALGGMDFGIGATGAEALYRLLYRLGDASLAIARLFEAHVNALQLILRYGEPAQAEAAAAAVRAGHLFALWVTDPAAGGAALEADGAGFRLRGGKAFCSGAGVATRAIITAATPAGPRLLLVEAGAQLRVVPSAIRLGGMRGAITGSVDFTGMEVPRAAIIGAVDDYLREPVFSAGAWRGSAAALGALRSLLDIHRDELCRRGRGQDPHQRARFGQLVIAHETARLWTGQAALRACLEDTPPDAIIAYVNAARLAVETACLDGMRLTQRSLGISAFLDRHPAERICRDLAVYLRQPAPDEVLDSAAGYYLTGALPGDP